MEFVLVVILAAMIGFQCGMKLFCQMSNYVEI